MCHCLCKEYKRESKNTYLLEKTKIETNVLLVHPNSLIKFYSRLWMSSLCLKMLLKWIFHYGAVITVVGMCNNILIILTEINFSLKKKLKNFGTEIGWEFKKHLYALLLVCFISGKSCLTCVFVSRLSRMLAAVTCIQIQIDSKLIFVSIQWFVYSNVTYATVNNWCIVVIKT